MPRFSEINSVSNVLDSFDFLDTVKRESCFRDQSSEMIKYQGQDVYPVFINFYQCEDIPVHGKNKACLMLSGINPMGSRVCIIKEDIRPFVILAVPDDYKGKTYEYVEYISCLIRSKPSIDVVKFYNYHFFQIEKTDHLRLEFNSLMDRRFAIKTLNDYGFKTMEDDNDYTPMYLRHNLDIPINKWAILEEDTGLFYTEYFVEGIYSKIFHVQNDYTFRSLKAYEYPKKDMSLMNSWDIETKKLGKDMTIPKPGVNNYYISAISSSIGPWYDSDPAYSVVFTVIGIVPEILNVQGKVPPVLVVCRNEKEMLETYYRYLRIIRPEFENAFNGGNFDYPIIHDRCNYWKQLYVQYKGTGNNVNYLSPVTTLDFMMAAYIHTKKPMYYETPERFMRNVRVKLEAGKNSDITLPRFFGSICIDSMVSLVKAYPKIEQKNLETFLQRANLGGKEDMKYKDMHVVTNWTEVISKEGVFQCKNVLPENLTDHQKDMLCKFMYYSYIDSLKLHWLFHKESFILSNRALAELGRYPIVDTFFKASGSILMNMIAKRAYDAGRAMSINYKKKDDDGTEEAFSGAYVVPPKYGLHRDRPVTGIDFSSLYPSLMAAFNLSPDMIVKPEDVEYYRSLGYTVLSLQIPYKICVKGKRKDKNGVLEHKICNANFIQHNGIINPDKDKTIKKHIKNIKWTLNGNVVFKIEGVEMKDTLNAILHVEKCLKEIGINPDHCKRESTVIKIYGRDGLFNECMGVNAKLGQELFDYRNEIKAPFKRIGELLEMMEKKGLTEAPWDLQKGASIPGSPMLGIAELKEIKDSLNAAQLAIKVMANTIYGKSGENGLEMYALEVAAGITYCGQNMATKPMITLVQDILGCEVMYGDTDSLYIKPPWRIFDDVIKTYKELRFERFGINYEDDIHEYGRTLSDEEVSLKVEYLWTPMIIETRKYISLVTEIVADTLCSMNNTRYLTMAYEEVGFPTYLSGKKKYALIAHEKEINFFPENIFLRGFDFKKRGQTNVARRIGDIFLKKILHPGYHGDNISLMRETLEEYSRQIDPNDFVVYKTYNPHKQAVEVNSIVEYMKEMHATLLKNEDYNGAEMYTPPMPGETFPYIYVNRDRKYDIFGKADAKFKAGQLAEPYRVVLESNSLKVNLPKYLEKMKGFLGRLIIADKIFDAVNPDHEENETEDDYYKRMDEARKNASQKYIMNIFGSINGTVSFEKNARLAKSIATRVAKTDIYPDIVLFVSKIMSESWTSMGIDGFISQFSHWIQEYILKVKNIVQFGLSRGLDSSEREIKDFYNTQIDSSKGFLRQFVNDFIKMCPIVHEDQKRQELAECIARGAFSIFLGAIHMKHEHKEIMSKLSDVLDMIRIIEGYKAGQELLMSEKEKSKKIFTKNDKKEAVLFFISQNANQNMSQIGQGDQTNLMNQEIDYKDDIFRDMVMNSEMRF